MTYVNQGVPDKLIKPTPYAIKIILPEYREVSACEMLCDYLFDSDQYLASLILFRAAKMFAA